MSALKAKDMSKPLNVVWILVDSVRNYKGAGDDRDKLDLMSRFESESIHFSTVVTSAPSTLMSVSAMQTSFPSYCLARDYDNFAYDQQSFTALSSVLAKRDYSTEAVICFRPVREKLAHILPPVNHRMWPRGLTHGQKCWSNDQINQVLENMLARPQQSEPFFMYLHYNCRKDPETSQKVEWALEQLREKGILDNSILIMCSDHGYPDPSRGVNSQWFKNHNLSHDLLLTDDNILVPLYIRYPGCKPQVIDTPVSTLDITPTILDLLGINAQEEMSSAIRGQTLRPLMEGHEENFTERKLRVDARFMMQSHRKTAIRGRRHKFAIERDTGAKVLYDLNTDPLEEKNLAGEPAYAEILEEFEEALRVDESKTLKMHAESLLKGLGESFVDVSKKDSRVLVIDSSGLPERQLFSNVLKSHFRDATMHLFATGDDVKPKHESEGDIYSLIEEAEGLSDEEVLKAVSRLSREHGYTHHIILLSALKTEKQARFIRKVKREVGSACFVLDLNMKVCREYRPWSHPLRVLKGRKHFYKHEPLLFIQDVINRLR
jgi:hypothetical protein